MCLVSFEFFSVLEKLQCCCLIETSHLSKYCLSKDISKPLTICIITQSKCHKWWYTLEFVTECHNIKTKLAINMQIFPVTDVSDSIIIVMQTVQLKLIENKEFLSDNLWQLQTAKNSAPCLFSANDKQLWITCRTIVTNANWWWYSQINLIKGLIFKLSVLYEYVYPQT